MIDTSKIRPGDTGTVVVKFVTPVCGKSVEVYLDGQCIHLPTSTISSHTPAPWVPEPTDVVKWEAADASLDWKIIAIDGELAWIRRLSATNAFACLSDLTLIRKGAA